MRKMEIVSRFVTMEKDFPVLTVTCGKYDIDIMLISVRGEYRFLIGSGTFKVSDPIKKLSFLNKDRFSTELCSAIGKVFNVSCQFSYLQNAFSDIPKKAFERFYKECKDIFDKK